MKIHLETGASAFSEAALQISDAAFGARYISFRDVNRFLNQTDDINIGLIVWPGGTLAEQREDRYGFEFDELYNPSTGKPSLSEMMELAITKSSSLSIVLPTARYVENLDGLRADVQGFMQDLLGGVFGSLPEQLILQIGSEYFSNIPEVGDVSAASQYGTVAEVMVREIAIALNDSSINQIGADLSIAVQSGKTLADDVEIRSELSDLSLLSADMVIHHRFAYQPQGIDPRIDDLEDILAAWDEETEALNGDAPNLFVSAWNVVSLTRQSILEDYVVYQNTLGNPVLEGDIDLEGRTTTDFERYWQDQLEAPAYGQAHAVYILESFSSYAEAGMAASSLYGFDIDHPGRVSLRGDDGESYTFVGGEMLQMIYESVGDTRAVASEGDYSPDDPITTYAFENDDKLVVFLSAGSQPPGNVELDIDGLGTMYQEVWAERLTSTIDPDWMHIFGIPDNPDVDESAEAETFSLGIRSAAEIDLGLGGLGVSLTSPHEIIRLAFAKTEVGAEEIASWSEALGVDLAILDNATSDIPEEEGADDSELFEIVADAGFGGAVLLLALLFFL